MPRKKENKPEAYYDTFPTTLRKIMEKQGKTQQDVAEAIEKTRQAVGYYCDGSSSPDWKTLVRLAQHFGVSTDYLLGLTDISSPDPNIRKFSEITGLSERCIENLKIIHSTDQAANPDVTVMYEFSETINCLVENEPQFSPIVWIGRYLSVPKIKESDYYISVSGDIKQRNPQKDFEMDEFMSIDSSLLESALLERATSELFLLKDELNKSVFSLTDG